jgi:pimeloyl-ACP methyl ester carboxylesterase
VTPETFNRRHLLRWSALAGASIVAGGAAVFELVDHSALPGHQALITFLGDCDVAVPPMSFAPLGPTESGTFFSRARNQTVGYTIAYPPGHASGSQLPLVVMLHGFGANHTDALSSMSPAQAMALDVDGGPLPPMAMVTVDGGGGYWNPHPKDNPMAMVVEELIPMCQARGLGRPRKIGTMGVSMGGYGALLLAEKYPQLFSAVAAISPAIWTSYSQARSANPGAYASNDDFVRDDAVTHADALAGIPVRVASGANDPFHPGVEALARTLPSGAVVQFSKGCHTGSFFASQEPPSLAFLAHHLSS